MLHAIAFEDSHVDLHFMDQVVHDGGAAAVVMRDADLAKVFAELVDDLHHEYLLGFTPVFDGKSHTISVKTTRPNTVVRARGSYVVEKRQGSL